MSPASQRTESDPKLRELAQGAGLRRVDILQWRDLEDVEAGGSEVHAAEVARHWAAAGVDVTMRSSYAQGHPPSAERDGYKVVRRAGRYLVFPRAAASEWSHRYGPRDGLVEVWNGVPFLSPLWDRGPRIVFLHHVHSEMWRMVLPENPRLANAGDVFEREIAPKLYRRTKIVTLSNSTKSELVDGLGFSDERVDVVPPGIDPRFVPGEAKAPRPLIVAVGRLMPPKRFDGLIETMAKVVRRRPDAQLVIVGSGYERDNLRDLVADLDLADNVTLAGRVDDDDLLELYQRAWVVASMSIAEGWGMTLTEAAACGTPAIASDISGHRDAVADQVSGILAPDDDAFAAALIEVLSNPDRRRSLSEGALRHASRFTWLATATGAMEALAGEAHRLAEREPLGQRLTAGLARRLHR